MGQPPRVAVIGSGLAGLATAFLLRREGADVWLVEKAQKLGLHSWSVEFDGEGEPVQQLKSASFNASSGKTLTGAHECPSWSIDVPMRSFQGGYYPLLIALYTHLGFSLHPTHYTFSFSKMSFNPFKRRRQEVMQPDAPLDTYLIYSGASGFSVPTLPTRALSSPRSFLRALTTFLSAAMCYLVFVFIAFLSWHDILPTFLGGGNSITLGELVDMVSSVLERPVQILPPTPFGNLFTQFARDTIVPLFSAVGTMTASDVWSTQARHILDYVHLTVGTSHYVLGEQRTARDVARLLVDPVSAQGIDHIRLGTSIRAMRYRCRPDSSRVVILVLDNGDELEVDRVVIATQASTAAALLSTLEPSLVVQGEQGEARRVARMRQALSEVEYRDTIVVTHRDMSVLPLAADTRDINLVQPVYWADISNCTSSPVPPLSPSQSSTSSASSSPCPTPHDLPPLLGHIPYFAPSPEAVYTMATHVVYPPRSRSHPPILQTTNPVVPIDPDKSIAMARMERALPLRDTGSLSMFDPPVTCSSQKPLVYLAGSYAYPGIPLLEGCVGSARQAVASLFGADKSMLGGVNWDSGRGRHLGRLWRGRWKSENMKFKKHI